MQREIPNVLYYPLQSEDFIKQGYRKHLDFIRAHMSVNYLGVSTGAGVAIENTQQCHAMLADMTEYAHQLGIKVCLRLFPAVGFFNTSVFSTDPVDRMQIFPIPDPEKAEAIVSDVEAVADKNGFVQITHRPQGARPKLMPIYSQVVKAYVFDKASDGFYKKGTLEEVTDQVSVSEWYTDRTTVTLDLGSAYAGKHVFVMMAWFYNVTAVSDDWEYHKKLIDAYADIPFDGLFLDEYGYILLDTSNISKDPTGSFRGRIYSFGMKKTYTERWGLDMDRLLFDMRYAPEGNPDVRIRAINTYFEKLRVFPMEVEKQVYEYGKKVFGEDAYIGCHNTFHNVLDADEIWHTACNWWDVPRDFAHTDEDIPQPIRLGMMMACRSPIDIDMYYHKDGTKHYAHMIEGAPFGTREWHHSYRDYTWGNSFTEPDFLANIRKIDEQIARLNPFQTQFPKTDLLIVYGAAAQNNWYPNEEARSKFDIDKTLQIVPKCREIWNAGYLCALAPDYAIEDGRIKRNGNQIDFNGHSFRHCLFLYPKYAKRTTYDFLNEAWANGVNLAVVGRDFVDFDGQEACLTVPTYSEFDLSVIEKMGVGKNRMDGGCVYEDGSFSLVGMGILTGEKTEFDFCIDGIRYHGRHTGLLAYREDEYALATAGSCLFVNGREIPLSYQ